MAPLSKIFEENFNFIQGYIFWNLTPPQGGGKMKNLKKGKKMKNHGREAAKSFIFFPFFCFQ